MRRAVPSRAARSPRRRALGLAHVNGALWSLGNGLTTGNLVSYLAQDLGAEGFQVGLILALPSLVGLLRLAAPALIRWLGSARAACLACLGVSYGLLLGLPGVSQSERILPGWTPLAVLIALVCVHQLFEYLGSVALWAWFGELVPAAIRGRYFARRQVWQLVVLIPAALGAGWFADAWKRAYPDHAWLAFAVPNALGALALLTSLVPLAAMPAQITGRRTAGGGPPAQAGRKSTGATGRPWQRALAEPAFRRLVVFGCWVGLFNGLTQAAQGRFPYDVLHLGMLPLQCMLVAMRLGQLALSPLVGRFSDRFGNRPALILGQATVALGPLCYWAATPEQPYWIAGASVLWSAFVVLNICLPNLLLKLSPGGSDPGYIATYFALSTLVYALGTLIGGRLLDALAQEQVDRWLGLGWNHYAWLFAGGFVCRALGVLILVWLDEPGAATLSELVHRRPSRPVAAA